MSNLSLTFVREAEKARRTYYLDYINHFSTYYLEVELGPYICKYNFSEML